MTERILTISEAVDLGAIVSATNWSRVARLIDGHVHVGTARSIGDENGNFAGRNDDVRDCYLRVTLDTGFEAFWLVSELMGEVRSGYFVTNYQG